MKVLFLNTYDFKGGAGKGAYRHHKGFRNAGLDCTLLVQRKETNDSSVAQYKTGPIARIRSLLRNFDPLPILTYLNRRKTPWSVGWAPNGIASRVAREDPDLVHLHWIGHGYVPISALPEFKKPIVWQLADPWAFTGGCHYPRECLGYRRSCGMCPELGSRKENDLTRWTWNQKKRYWKDLDLTVVAQSRWMRDCAASSSLFSDFRIEVIPAGLDEATFRIADREAARISEGLPTDKKLILAGAVNFKGDPRKGFDHLAQAVNHLAENGWADNAEVIIFGADDRHAEGLGLKTTCFGFVSNERLVRLYNAADVYVSPAREEAFGQTVLEALACGTPGVGFRVGGIPDMIEHTRTGYLAEPFDSKDLADGIAWVIGDEQRWTKLSRQSIERVERNFTMTRVAQRYKELYEDLLERGKP